MEEVAALHAWVEGRVQGVGFRAFVQEGATRLGLTGWVRNVGEDQVEVWAEGKKTSLGALLGLLQRGPRSSFVQMVREEWQTPRGKYPRFQILSSEY